MSQKWQEIVFLVGLLLLCIAIWVAIAVVMIATIEGMLKLLEILLKMTQS